MKKIIYSLILAAPLAVVASCSTDLRTIYDTTDLVLDVEGSWANSLNQSEMRDATVLLHHESGEQSKVFLSRPNGVFARVEPGDYDVMVFNGIMESEDVTNLNHVRFRGVNRHGTFEVYSAGVEPIMRLSRAEGELIVSNEMDIFTFEHHRVSIDGDEAIHAIYEDGERVNGDMGTVVAQRIESTPRTMSFRYRVSLTNIVNPTSARSADGAVRGFMGSVFVPAAREYPRRGVAGTHHLRLASESSTRIRTRADGEQVGTLFSPRFVSFGPPMPTRGEALPASGEYFFEPVFLLHDGSEYRPGLIDITAQVNASIERMMRHYDGRHLSDNENNFNIVIDDEIVLPVIAGGGGLPVDVEPWPDDEVVIVWM